MDKKNTASEDTKVPNWPNAIHTRDELDSALEAGLKSGVSTHTIKDIFEEEIAKHKNG